MPSDDKPHIKDFLPLVPGIGDFEHGLKEAKNQNLQDMSKGQIAWELTKEAARGVDRVVTHMGEEFAEEEMGPSPEKAAQQQKQFALFTEPLRTPMNRENAKAWVNRVIEQHHQERNHPGMTEEAINMIRNSWARLVSGFSNPDKSR